MSAALESLVDRVGNTPLVRLARMESGLAHVRLYAKLEHLNPGGSIKDRVAAESLWHAQIERRIGPNKPMVALGGGNLGVSYAWVGAVLGIPVKLVTPRGASAAHVRIASTYGAQIARVADEATALAEIEASGFGLDVTQASSALGTIADELILQTQGELTHIVAGVGSGATAARLREEVRRLGRDIRIVGVEPADAPIPGLRDASNLVLDEGFFISATEAREHAARLLADEGLFVGPSSGAAVAAAIALAHKLEDAGRSGSIAVLFADRGERYLDLGQWEERFKW
jgi:cysteine synthase